MKAMKKAMKAMVARKGAKSVTKGGLAEALATACDLKKSDCSKVLSALADVVAANLKKTGRVIVRASFACSPARRKRRRQASGKCSARFASSRLSRHAPS